MTKLIQPIILCGGSGTRLWPVSRQFLPKQFVPMFEGKSLFELTLDRIGGKKQGPFLKIGDLILQKNLFVLAPLRTSTRFAKF